jgi:ribosomal-protein-alanine N-acetyltransferase
MIQISKCSYGDIDTILEIEKRSFKFPYSKQTFWYYIAAHNAGFLVARDESKITGYIISSYEDTKATIVSIAVDQRYRRKGIGSMLLKATLQQFPATINEIELQVSVNNQEAISFYLAHGFTKRHPLRRYYPDGLDAIVMSLEKQAVRKIQG